MTRGNRKKETGNARFFVNSAVLLLLIIYGSLYPFEWEFENTKRFILYAPIGLIDAIENILLFAPIGAYWGWSTSNRRTNTRDFFVLLFVAFSIATVLQWLQIYLPRVPQLSDIFFNVIGYLAGWLFVRLSMRWFRWKAAELLHSDMRLNQFGLIMLVIWGFAELFPFIPTLDVSTVAGKLKSFLGQPVWQPRRMFLHFGMTVIGLNILRTLLHDSFQRSKKSTAVYLATVAAVMAGKFFVIDQILAPSVVVGMIAGTVFILVIERSKANLRSLLLITVAALTYFVYSLLPFDWNWTPKPMNWLPFSSSLNNSISSVVRNVAFECMCFGALLWNSLALGGALKGTTIVAMVVVFACEYVQKFMPMRTPETTSVILVFLVSWLLSNTEKRSLTELNPSRSY